MLLSFGYTFGFILFFGFLFGFELVGEILEINNNNLILVMKYCGKKGNIVIHLFWIGLVVKERGEG